MYLKCTSQIRKIFDMGAVVLAESKSLFDMVSVIPKSGLANLAKHEYKSGGYTPLDMVCYKYWWDPVLNLIPLKMAPNLITVIGFLFALSNLLTIYITNPELRGSPSSFTQIWAGFSFLFYMMMDAIDGRQARRTKSGSPLGQLLDHGCDSILSGVISIVLASTLRIGVGMDLFILMAVSQIVFFIGQWEEKHTGVCRTCVLGLFGTTEYLLSFSALQIGVLFLEDISLLRSLVFYSTLAIGLASGLYCIINVLVHTRKISSIATIFPILLLNVLFGCIISSSPVSSFIPFLSLSLLNSFLIIQTILSTVTRTPVSMCNQLLIISPAIGMAIAAPVPENLLLAYTILVGICVCQYVVRAVLQISNFLNIKVFRI